MNYSLFLRVQDECSRFVEESQGLPLYKNLPVAYSDIHRVKMRKRRHNGSGTIPAEVLDKTRKNLLRQGLFAYGAPIAANEDVEPFYVFPVNGYQFMFCPEIRRLSEDCHVILSAISGAMNDKQGTDLMQDVIDFSYQRHDLIEGIRSGAEIIFYSIPNYYAFRVSAFNNYKDLLSSIGGNR